MKIVKMLVDKDKYSLKCPYIMEPEFIVIHNTANNASARNEVSYMIRNSNSTSFHYAIDDKEIVQGIPENRNAWHAGDGRNGKGNRKGLSIEICYSKDGGNKFIKAENNTAKFVAQLLYERGWGIEKVKKHQDFSGKYCPHRTLDMGWKRFLDIVENELNLLKNRVKVNFNGVDYVFKGFLKDGTNYVQIREVFEKLGYEVSWDNKTKTVLIKGG